MHQIKRQANHSRNGFTLVELMFAMAFIAIMLVAIAACVIQIGNIYQRGITLTAVNTAGRNVASILQKDIAATSPSKLPVATTNNRLCLGTHTYLWNIPGTSSNKTTDGTAITFAQVDDTTAAYCQKDSDGNYPTPSSVRELLNNASSADRGLVLYSLTVKKVGDDADALYTITYTVGTSDQSVITIDASDASNDTCNAPSGTNSDINYCSVNTFSVTARADNTGSVIK